MPYGIPDAVFVQGIIAAIPAGAVANSLADTTSSEAVEAHASAIRARKTPDIIAFLDIYSITAA
jgi:hypothetical protein